MENNKIDFHKILWYFIIFSVIGLIIETVFCFLTTGVIESRKGLIIGPFCPVYGVGAVIIICTLNRYKNSYIKLFLYGSILGNIVEYILSYALDAIYGMRFWDYSYIAWNLNGRICIKYSIFWGILAIVLIKFIDPIISKNIEKIKTSKKIDLAIFIFFIIDALITVWGITTYQNRIDAMYNNVYNEDILNNIEEKIFSNDIMVKIFPNLRYIDNNGGEHYIRDLIEQS